MDGNAGLAPTLEFDRNGGFGRRFQTSKDRTILSQGHGMRLGPNDTNTVKDWGPVSMWIDADTGKLDLLVDETKVRRVAGPVDIASLVVDQTPTFYLFHEDSATWIALCRVGAVSDADGAKSVTLILDKGVQVVTPPTIIRAAAPRKRAAHK